MWPSASVAEPLFHEASSASGFEFVHRNGMSGEKFFHEMMGSGVALLDYDNDGDLDVYLVQGHALPPLTEKQKPSDRLLRNVSSGGVLRFEDATAEAGVEVARGYGMGVATGDIDNDGWVDLYLTNWGGNQLLRNLGPDSSGRVRFEEIADRAGVADPSWSVSASFADIDRDGDLDLYVANYVVFELAIHKPCRNYTGAPDYCSPLAYGEASDRLYVNNGDGTFRDVSRSAGLRKAGGAGLGVVAVDLNGDRWTDFYVANDQSANQHWINRGDGTFRDESLLAGTAVNAEGRAEAGMGVAAGDVDGDGDVDLLVSHLDRETNTLYVNDGGGFFDDATARSGMARASWDSTGFGLTFFDIENDGELDVAVANGAVKDLEALVRAKDPFPLHQKNQLFRGGGGTFTEVTATAGPAFELSEVSRGLAVGDLDNDGDADLVISNNSGPARLLINQVGHKAPWLGLRLMERGRDALGAEVSLERDGAPALWRRVQADGSYASANDPRVLFGLGGSAAKLTAVVVRWSDGAQERFKAPALRSYHTLTRGDGQAVPSKTAKGSP
ncbi:MAG: CRTAC1 family protein [Acidobacteriota bacterium]